MTDKTHEHKPDWYRELRLSQSDISAFKDWQRLSADEKDALIWVAKHHPTIMQGVMVLKWLGQTGYVIGRVGFLAGALLAAIALYNMFTGTQ